MTKQTIVGRVAQLAKADIDALLDQAEDPQKTVDQLIHDYTGHISEAEDVVEGMVRDLRLLQQDHALDAGAVAEWGGKALSASRSAEELRAAGDRPTEAERFDTLARIALGHQWESEQEAAFMEPTIAAQKNVVDRLGAGLTQMRSRLDRLKATRERLITSSRTAHGHGHHLHGHHGRKADSVATVDVLDPTHDLNRFELKLRREEARARGTAEAAPSSLDTQFESLDPVSGSAEVDARLARLKSGAV